MGILGRPARFHGIVRFVAAVALCTSSVTARAARLFSPQANQLDVYDLDEELPKRQGFIPSAAGGGRDLNGQVCVFPDREHILLGDDTGQTKGAPQGWGIIDLASRKQVGKLIADYASTKLPDNYGCAIETDGDSDVRRIFVSQLGAGNFLTPDGQLIVFFPSSRSLDAVFRRGSESCGREDCVCPVGDCSGLTKRDSDWCVLDDDLRTASGLARDESGNLYVTEQAPSPLPGRILKYAASSFPRSAADCPGGKKILEPEIFIRDFRAATPSAIVAARGPDGKPTGNWYVSSVFLPPVINEYDSQGTFVRRIVPRGHGNPFGLAVGSDGTLYFADLGISFKLSRLRKDPGRLGFSFGEGEGSVQRVRFSKGNPLPPEVLADKLDYPDGLGLLE